jgi:cytochrome c oxidase subunit 3
MTARRTYDLSALPDTGLGPNTTPWWGVLGFIALEGAGFSIAIGAYLYLYVINGQWPLSAAPPNHWPGTLITIVLIASALPNGWTDRAAHAGDLGKMRIGLIIMSVIGIATVAIRFWEFAHLNVRWDDNAYGSMLWFLLALHATHLITDLGDTLVLAVLMFTRHAVPRRYSDVADNCFYWYFVIVTWLPLYVLIYWVPRLGSAG